MCVIKGIWWLYNGVDWIKISDISKHELFRMLLKTRNAINVDIVQNNCNRYYTCPSHNVLTHLCWHLKDYQPKKNQILTMRVGQFKNYCFSLVFVVVVVVVMVWKAAHMRFWLRLSMYGPMHNQVSRRQFNPQTTNVIIIFIIIINLEAKQKNLHAFWCLYGL